MLNFSFFICNFYHVFIIYMFLVEAQNFMVCLVVGYKEFIFYLLNGVLIFWFLLEGNKNDFIF